MTRPTFKTHWSHFAQTLLIGWIIPALVTQPLRAAPPPALPSGGNFVAGAGAIAASGNAVTITQSSLKGIIDWNAFSIGQGGTVLFKNGGGATLNRVNGASSSLILGVLQGDGSVYLLNPQGILIGKGARIHTGGDFVATTLDVSNDAFLKGGSLLFAGNSLATVKNLGAISSSGGSIFLIASSVKNRGGIDAPNGTAALAAGQSVLIKDSSDDQRVYVQAGTGDVTNAGSLAGAEAELKAAGGNIYALAGKRSEGVIRATGTATRDGHVWLISQTGKVAVGGAVSAQNVSGAGGAIETSGATVTTDAAKITTGLGGSWLLDPDDLLIDSSLAGTIQTSLNTGTNVTEQTSVPVSGGHGDITVASNIAWTTGANLTLSAYRNIAVNAGISVSNSGAGNLVMRADNASTGTGAITFGAASGINFSGSTGTASLFYDPTGGTKYQNPVNYSSFLTANGSVSNQITAYMLVNNVTDLQNINTNLNGTYALGKDIDASSASSFTPIGDNNNFFNGLFDGQFHTIDHLTVTTSSSGDIGLFGASQGTLRNVSLAHETITDNSSTWVGGLAGENYGTIKNSSTSGTLSTSNGNIGGLVGYNDGSISTSKSSVSVSLTSGSGAGGLVGENDDLIADSYSTGSVSGSSSWVGGLVGDNEDLITRSFATGHVSGSGNIGGLVGLNEGFFSNSYWDTTTTGTSVASACCGGNSGTTGQSTSTLQNGSLPTGFSSTNWNVSSGHYPSLFWETPIITVSGTVFNGSTPLGSATVIGLVGGQNVGTGVSNGSGVFSFSLTSGTNTSGGLLAYLSGGSNLGNTFTYGNIDGSFTGTNIYVNSLRFINLTNINFSSMVTALNTAMGSVSASNFLYTINTGALSLNSGKNLYILNSAPSFSIDQAVPTTGTVTINSTGAVSQSSPLSASALELLGAGGAYTLTNTSNAITTVAANTGSVNLKTNSNGVSVGTAGGTSGITATGAVTIVTPGNIALNSAISAVGSGTPLTLADGGTFVNSAGSSGLSVSSGGGRWLVYSQNPSNDNPGSLSNSFKQYNATYGVTTPAQGTGNGLLFTLAPTVSASLTETVTKTYNGATGATLTSSNYAALTGAVDSDSLSLVSMPTSGSYSTKDVGSSKPVTVTGLSINAVRGAVTVYGYQFSGSASGNIGTITPAILTATVTANNKTYDRTTSATGSTGALTGIFGSDSVSFTGTDTYSFATKTAGNGKTVTESGLGITGTDAGNYILATLTGEANITPATLNATVTANNKVYDGGTAANGSTGSLTGILGSDTVSFTGSDTYAFNTKNVGNGKTVTESGLTLAGPDAGNYSLAALTTSANITPATLTATVTANSKVYDGTTPANGSTGTLTGILGSDNVNFTGTGSYSFATKNVGNAKTVTESGLTLAGTDAANYTLATLTGEANITPATLSAPVTANNKVYDATTAATGTTGALIGIIGSDAVSFTGTDTYSFATKNVGNAKTVTESGLTLTGSDAGNYNLAALTGEANITPATLTATVTANNKVYNATTAATGTTGTLTGILGIDTVNFTGSASYSFADRNAGNSKPVTEAGLSLTGTDAANYTLAPLTGTANITPATLTATVTANNKVYNTTTTATGTTGTLTGILSDDSVSFTGTASYSFADKNVGNNKTVTETGLTITGSDVANYTLGTLTGTASITPATLTATVTANNKVYDTTTTATGTVGSLTGILGSDDVSFTGTAGYSFFNKNVGNSKFVFEYGLSLTGTDAANYSLAELGSTANITPATLTAIVTANNKVYNATTNATGTTGSLTGVLGSDSVSFTGTAGYSFADRNAGNGKTVFESGLSLTGTDAGNYTLASLTGTADITPAMLTATVLANNKVYDASTNATGTTGTLTGVLSDDQVSFTGTPSYSFANKNVGNAKTVTESGLTITGSDAGNYTLANLTTEASITPATLTATVTANNKVYDATTVATGTVGPLTGILGSDDVSFTGTAGYSFNNKNVGNAKFVYEYGLSLTGSDAANYSLNELFSSANITPATLTAIVTANNKVYDATTNATGTTGTLTGILGSDSVNFTGTAGYSFADRNAGNGKTVFESGLSLAGSDAGNYTLAALTGTADITPAMLTATVIASNKTYDATTNATGTTGTLTGVLSDDQVSFTGTPSYSFANKNVGNAKTVTESGLTITGTDAGNYTLANLTTEASITPATLTATVTANNKVYDATTVATGTVGPLTGILGSDDVSFTGTAGYSFTNKNVGNAKFVYEYGLSLAGSDAANYSLSELFSSANITPATLTAIVTANNKVYDATANATGTTGTLTGILGSDSVAFTGTAGYSFADRNAGNGKTVFESGLSLAGTDAGNYTLAALTGSANITPAMLTATVIASNKTYDATTNATGTTGTLTGILSDDQVSFTGTPSYSFANKNVGNAKTVTESGLTITGTDAGNYTLANLTTEASITPATLTATITASNKVYDATTTAAASIGPLVGVLGSDNVAFTGSPSYSFEDKNVGNAKFVFEYGLSLAGTDAANYTLGELFSSANITPATLTAIVTATNKVYDRSTIATGTTGALAGVLGSDSVNFTGTASYSFANKNVGTAKTVTESGLSVVGTDSSNYTLAALTGTADITPAALTTAVAANNKVYDATTVATGSTSSLTGILEGDSVNLAGTAAYSFSDKNVGSDKLVTGSGLTLSGTDASNYLLTIFPGAANITPASLVAVVSANNKVYDATTTATATTGSFSGLLGSDTVSLTGTASYSFADKNVGTAKTVTESGLALTGPDAANYNLTVLTGAANITAATLSATVNADNKVYDATTAATGTTGPLSGLLGSDSVTFTGTDTYSFADKNVGTAKTVTESGLSLAGPDAANYTLAALTGVANITPALLSAAVIGQNKVYDGTVGASGSLTALHGVIGSDTVTLSSASYSFSDKNAGTGKPVMASGATLAGADAANYSLTISNGMADITPAVLVYVSTPATRAAGIDNLPFTGSVIGFVSGETQSSATTGTLLFTSPATSASAVGSYAINGGGLVATNGNYTFVQTLANATALTIIPAGPPVQLGNTSASQSQTTITNSSNTVVIDSSPSTLPNQVNFKSEVSQIANVELANTLGFFSVSTSPTWVSTVQDTKVQNKPLAQSSFFTSTDDELYKSTSATTPPQ